MNNRSHPHFGVIFCPSLRLAQPNTRCFLSLSPCFCLPFCCNSFSVTLALNVCLTTIAHQRSHKYARSLLSMGKIVVTFSFHTHKITFFEFFSICCYEFINLILIAISMNCTHISQAKYAINET